MISGRRPTLRGRRLAAALVGLTRIYWRSPDAGRGALLLAGAVALELATVQVTFRVAEYQRGLVDVFEDRDSTRFLYAFAALVAVGLSSVLVSVGRIYLRQLLEIRWRRGLTADALRCWMAPEAYAERQLHGDAIDNPDQRVAEDIRDFVASALGLSLSLLSALASLVAFGGLLWRLSADFELPVAGGLPIPGLLLWVAVAFAVGAIVVAHLAGRRLVPINNDRLRAEADFRYGLMRFRDNVEPIVLSGGEQVERANASERFHDVVGMFLRLIRAERDLNLLTGGLGQLSGLAPFLVAAPAYFSGALTLGMLVQARIAYDQVSGALLWFVNAYREIARWRANAERVDALLGALETTRRDLASEGPTLAESPSGVLTLDALRLRLPAGRALVVPTRIAIEPGAHVAILGAGGPSKTILFRALAGIWTFGRGRIERPAPACTLFLPQEPYLPNGTLRAALSFPAAEGAFPDARIAQALRSVGLAPLGDRLAEAANWEQHLSAQERQRLSFARALLQRPSWLVLDQAASTLDAASERQLYESLLSGLPGAALVALEPGPGALELLPRRFHFTRRADGDVALQAA